MRVFYEVPRVPVHSNLLIADRAAALAQPAGALELAVCETCGYIANVAFDLALEDYSELYEEAQGFSPRFSRFLDELIDGLIGRYDLAGGRVLEVGCGKGAFLVALCRRAGCSGVGVDPAYAERDEVDAAGADVTFVRAFYGPEHAGIPFDLACCRHTLEHIPAPAEFAAAIHAAAAAHGGALFVEVPDAGRVLRERAFWDVYYEHCSYFTAGSLGRLLQAAGLGVTRSELGYDGQYLLVDSRPGPSAMPPPDDVAGVVAMADGFGRDVGLLLAAWRDELAGLRADGRTAVLWGAGSKAVGFLTGVGDPGAVTHVVDINPYKQGTFLPGTGQEIVAPEALTALRPDVVVVMNPIYAEEIGAQLSALGVSTDLRPLSA
ncbi:MAG: class I SAM-dependent methyltransferase [Thermoleophilia bacterium]